MVGCFGEHEICVNIGDSADSWISFLSFLIDIFGSRRFLG